MSDRVAIDAIAPSESAQWFGDRLGGILAPGNRAIASAITWCDHQLESGHTCLDFSLPVIANLAVPPDGGRASATAMLPTEWLEAIRACAHTTLGTTALMTESNRPLVLEGTRLFLAANHSDEIAIARSLRARATQASRWKGTRAGPASASTGAGDTIDPAQAAAVALISKKSLALVTGGPGTGKTTIASRMVDAVVREQADAKILLVAPTGKACARLTQSMRRAAESKELPPATRKVLEEVTAVTMHSALLRASGEAAAEADLVIVDECSMVGAALMRQLLDKVPATASLVLLGDAHQLASVTGGTVLSDIMPTSDSHPLAECTVRLTTSHRFPAGGDIAMVAAAVNDGDWSKVRARLEGGTEVVWHKVRSAKEVVDVSLARRAAASGNACILCGHRIGRDGSLAINRALVRTLGVTRDFDPETGEDFVGRAIIVTANDSVTGLVNGDTGTIEERASDGAQSAVRVAVFADRADAIPVAQLPAHEAAYALTIHKAQGSEYERVIVALPAEPSPVITRELLYTAITRTRGSVEIIATEAALQAAVETQVHRASGLRERMGV